MKKVIYNEEEYGFKWMTSDKNIMEKFKKDKEKILKTINKLKEYDVKSDKLSQLENFVLNNPLNDGWVCSFCGRDGLALEYKLDGVTKEAETGIYSADSIKLICFSCAH